MKSSLIRALAVVGCATALALCGVRSNAQLVLITSRTTFDALPGLDTVDWGQFGAPFTTVPSPSNANSGGGNILTVSQATGSMQRRDQGNGWGGNFAQGDRLLWTTGGGPMTIDFTNTVGGAGYQIQADFFGAFTARLDAFDASNNLIGFVTENGNSTSSGDNSAIFIGGTSTTPIKSIVISLTAASNNPNDFAINRLDTVGAAAVPEPGALAMMSGVLVSGLGLFFRRRR